jgi:glycosyltransferase involved in cell wall biosynthesis
MAYTISSQRTLRVALLSTCALTTPPRGYGGTELIVAELSRELQKLGHRPTVFATGDSTCVGAREALFAHAIWPVDRLAELRHASASWTQIATMGDFDVVHMNAPEAVPFTSFVAVPTVATIHHERGQALVAHYAAYPEVAYVAISRRQAELAWEMPFRAVIHHGVDPDHYRLGKGGRQFAFLGRLAPEKGPHLAVEAARRMRVPLVLGGEPQAAHQEYFEKEVAPMLGGAVSWAGELDQRAKVALLGASRATLFPIQWEEPFGLVMIESMLVGTPVIAYACGAAPEVVEDGVTGYLVHTLDEMCRRMRDVGGIDRKACRARARERWSAARMAREYVALYTEAIDRWTSTRARVPYEAPPVIGRPVGVEMTRGR